MNNLSVIIGSLLYTEVSGHRRLVTKEQSQWANSNRKCIKRSKISKWCHDEIWNMRPSRHSWDGTRGKAGNRHKPHQSLNHEMRPTTARWDLEIYRGPVETGTFLQKQFPQKEVICETAIRRVLQARFPNSRLSRTCIANEANDNYKIDNLHFAYEMQCMELYPKGHLGPNKPSHFGTIISDDGLPIQQASPNWRHVTIHGYRYSPQIRKGSDGYRRPVKSPFYKKLDETYRAAQSNRSPEVKLQNWKNVRKLLTKKMCQDEEGWHNTFRTWHFHGVWNPDREYENEHFGTICFVIDPHGVSYKKDNWRDQCIKWTGEFKNGIAQYTKDPYGKSGYIDHTIVSYSPGVRPNVRQWPFSCRFWANRTLNRLMKQFNNNGGLYFTRDPRNNDKTVRNPNVMADKHRQEPSLNPNGGSINPFEGLIEMQQPEQEEEKTSATESSTINNDSNDSQRLIEGDDDTQARLTDKAEPMENYKHPGCITRACAWLCRKICSMCC